MARIVRKIRRLIRGRMTAGRCVMALVTVGLIKVSLLFLFLFVVRNNWTRPIHPNVETSGTFPANFAGGADQGPIRIGDFLWRSDPKVSGRVLKELNMNEEEAKRNLPLTLNSTLWLNNPTLCTDNAGNTVRPDILLVVHTAPHRFQRRLLMRNTIGDKAHFRPFKVYMVFLVGRVFNSSLQDALQSEHQLYMDLVQGDFHDTDYNLSHKGVMGFRWVWQYCAQARYVVKLNDDVFFDTYKMLLRYRGVFEDRSRSLFCNVLLQDTMPIYRGKKHPWAVDDRQFPGLKTFPYTYCSGVVVVITTDLIPELYRAAFFTPAFWVEDVYLFGMLPSMLYDVSLVHLGHRNKFINLNTSSALSCMKKHTYLCSVLATVCPNTETWEDMWNITYHLHLDTSFYVPFIRLPSYG